MKFSCHYSSYLEHAFDIILIYNVILRTWNIPFKEPHCLLGAFKVTSAPAALACPMAVLGSARRGPDRRAGRI